jgi:hypothetical protein
MTFTIWLRKVKHFANKNKASSCNFWLSNNAVMLFRIKILERQNGPQYKKNEDNHVLNLLGFGERAEDFPRDWRSLSGPQKKKKIPQQYFFQFLC